MKRVGPSYAELKAENAQIKRRVAELEDLVRGLTGQLAEILRTPRRQPPSPPEGGPEKAGA